MTNRISRLAPSPTGALHLGNARTFLVNWSLARRHGWTLLMRIEDLDGPRVKADAAAATLDLLAWLGIDHDGPAVVQSHDLSPYERAMSDLADRSLVYACDLTRRQIEQAAAAPHAGEHELCCPASLRPEDPGRFRFDARDTNYRLVVPDREIVIEDRFAGRTVHRPAHEVGDFVVWTRRGVPAYQLAVVVDDARHGVTDVVRGDDLLPSAARQQLIYEALGAVPPRWWHVPLVLGEDGRRLAKRHGDTRLATYREAGVPAARIIGLIADWCGATTGRRQMTAAEFRDEVDLLSCLPRDPVTFTDADHRWLMEGAARRGMR
jgi:glutamyl-tRNA synthetase